jgi:HAD superfamily hydrolase (TIGR01549 family)
MLSIPVPIKSVVFDLGETLVCEDRMWTGWAAYLGVPANEFQAALEDVIARGEHHRKVFDRFRPGFDFEAAQRERDRRGERDAFTENDLYPDARPCLKLLRAGGYRLGIAGNQPVKAEPAVRALALELDFIATSAGLGVEKPAPAFFAKVAELAAASPAEIAYVGDRLDNDVLPARRAGMVAVFLARGPWGRLHATRDDVRLADIRIGGLLELPAALATLATRQ